MNGSGKAPGSSTVLRRSQRISNLQSTPPDADVKNRFEDSVSSDFSMKWGSLKVTQKGEGRNERRVSLRLMGLGKGVRDSSETLRGSSSSDVAPKATCQKERSSVKSLDGSCGVSSDLSMKGGSFEATQRGGGGNGRLVSLRLMGLAKGVKDSSEILRRSRSSNLARKRSYREEHSSVKILDDCCGVLTQKGDSQEQQRRSVRLMSSGRSGENGIHLSEERIPLEAIQKRDCRKARRNSHIVRGSVGEFKESSDFSVNRAYVKSSEKGNCRKKRRISVTSMDSANGVEKVEMGMNKHEELRAKVDREVSKGNCLNSTTAAIQMEEGKKGRKLQSGDIGAIEKRSEPALKGCNLQGWTKDQEAALHRSYFTSKPSPHFWKKVSKMVFFSPLIPLSITGFGI